jgi:hypothetical protein
MIERAAAVAKRGITAHAHIVAACLGVLMGVMVGFLLHGT